MSSVMQHKNDQSLNIQLTQSAQAHLLSYLKMHKEYIGVRLSLKKTGCSGLSYVLDYVSTENKEDLRMPLGDSYLFFVDKDSYSFLKNLHIDYVRQGLNHKMIFNNPNQTGQCGCGESFTVN